MTFKDVDAQSPTTAGPLGANASALSPRCVRLAGVLFPAAGVVIAACAVLACPWLRAQHDYDTHGPHRNHWSSATTPPPNATGTLARRWGLWGVSTECHGPNAAPSSASSIDGATSGCAELSMSWSALLAEHESHSFCASVGRTVARGRVHGESTKNGHVWRLMQGAQAGSVIAVVAAVATAIVAAFNVSALRPDGLIVPLAVAIATSASVAASAAVAAFASFEAAYYACDRGTVCWLFTDANPHRNATCGPGAGAVFIWLLAAFTILTAGASLWFGRRRLTDGDDANASASLRTVIAGAEEPWLPDAASPLVPSSKAGSYDAINATSHQARQQTPTLNRTTRSASAAATTTEPSSATTLGSTTGSCAKGKRPKDKPNTTAPAPGEGGVPKLARTPLTSPDDDRGDGSGNADRFPAARRASVATAAAGTCDLDDNGTGADGRACASVGVSTEPQLGRASAAVGDDEATTRDAAAGSSSVGEVRKQGVDADAQASPIDIATNNSSSSGGGDRTDRSAGSAVPALHLSRVDPALDMSGDLPAPRPSHGRSGPASGGMNSASTTDSGASGNAHHRQPPQQHRRFSLPHYHDELHPPTGPIDRPTASSLAHACRKYQEAHAVPEDDAHHCPECHAVDDMAHRPAGPAVKPTSPPPPRNSPPISLHTSPAAVGKR